MILSRQAQERILFMSNRHCQCMNTSHRHPSGMINCDRELKSRYYFVATKSYPTSEKDFIVICQSCHSESRSLRPKRY